jgi:hypothetical protein
MAGLTRSGQTLAPKSASSPFLVTGGFYYRGRCRMSEKLHPAYPNLVSVSVSERNPTWIS